MHCDNLLMHVQQRGHGNREGRRPCEVSADPLTPSATSSCGVPPGQELQGGRLRPRTLTLCSEVKVLGRSFRGRR